MTPGFDFSGYVGLPWLERGRDRRGLDCWGLHRLVTLDGLGVDLPSYDEGYSGPADRAAIERLIHDGRGSWHQVPAGEAASFDLVLLFDRPWHVGTIVEPGRMLHMPEGRDSVIEPLSACRFGRRIEGLYRHEAVS